MKSLLPVLLWLLSNPLPSFSFNIDPHTDDFKLLVLNNDVFVDKTMLIEEFMQFKPKHYIPLIIRPRGWGKSTNLDMLRKFFEIEVDVQGNRLPSEKLTNDKLFLGGEFSIDKNSPPRKLNPLKISHLPSITQHMGEIPVILVKFENVTGKCYEEIEQSLKSRVAEAFQNHRYLLNYTGVIPAIHGEKNFKKIFTGDFNTASLRRSLFILSLVLYDFHGKRVVILVDDYDAPLINAHLQFGHKKKEYKKVVDLLRSMYQKTLKGNPFMFKGLVSGILKISFDTAEGEDSIPKSDDMEVCTFFHPRFSHFFGFTRLEVKDMVEKLPISVDVDQMNSWYGGYAIDENIYMNGGLVMKSISCNGSMGFYEQSGIVGEALLENILTTDKMQPKIQALIAGQKLYFNNFMLWMSLRWESLQEIAILFHYGFLNKTTVVSPELAVPNKQMQHGFEMKSLKWVATKFGANSSGFVSFAECLSNGSVQQFKETLTTFLGKASELIQGGEKKAKAVYNAMIIALQTALSSSHEKIADGLADGFILEPKLGRSDTAIVFKYKIIKKKGDLNFGAKSSLEEINGYLNETSLKTSSHIRKINKIGLAFCGIQLAMEDQIENISTI